jgi:HAE1 family hydrophobic/amphiphilic exporter-1
VVAAVRTENQDLPVGAIRSLAQERVGAVDARMDRPEDFGKINRGAQGRLAGQGLRAGAPCGWSRFARVADWRPREIDSLALYNGQRTLLLTVQKRRTRTPSAWSTA